MRSNAKILRRAVLAALLVATFAGTGCSWFRGKSGYENSPESRPLEVPPDLDAPVSDPSMTVPAVAGSSAPAARAQATTGEAFVVDDALEGAWRRVGLALDRLDGVSVGERAEVLSVYNVTFEGESFLIKLASAGGGTRISAVNQDGSELTTGAAGKLLAQLRMRLT